MDIISLFSGCGGLDLGFQKAGFKIIWANDNDSEIWETYLKNHYQTILNKRSLTCVPSNEIPNCIGIIGGPPCQSWSEAGSQRGIDDTRGKLFFEFIRVLKDKQPLFFLAENVEGILLPKHRKAFEDFIRLFNEAGYNLSYKLLNAKYYDIPQDRKRVFIIGFHKKLNKHFIFPKPQNNYLTLKNAIWDLKDSALPSLPNNINNINCVEPNHEYMTGSFSTIYMSRNRVRSWDEPSFTIQAGGRHAPIHPQASKMIFVEKNKRIFDPNSPYPYRRLTIRECARIQTFPDNFLFHYKNLTTGYKMVGNAVPMTLAYKLASAIFEQLSQTI